jgi:hypothetical protein
MICKANTEWSVLKAKAGKADGVCSASVSDAHVHGPSVVGHQCCAQINEDRFITYPVPVVMLTFSTRLILPTISRAN